MGNLLGNPATDAGPLDAKDDSGPRSSVSPYVTSRPKVDGSAQGLCFDPYDIEFIISVFRHPRYYSVCSIHCCVIQLDETADDGQTLRSHQTK